jgi:5-methylcytosine-specific restriction endonuclease McrA
MSSNNSKLRDRLLSICGNICFICGKEFYKENPATLEHIIPVSKGGKSDIDNLVLSHQKCNRIRGNISFIKAMKWVPNFLNKSHPVRIINKIIINQNRKKKKNRKKVSNGR